MSQTVLLGDLGRVVTGKTPPKANPEYWGNFLDFITPTDFKDSKFIFPTRKLSDLGHRAMKRIVCPESSVIVTCIGSDMGKVGLAQKPFVSNQQINTLVVDSEKADPEFIYYLLKMNRPLLRRYAESGGSTMPIINKSTFESLPLKIPSMEVQKKIASILGAIDQKIELNRKMNETLEQMGQAIFKHYFIDNPEAEKWEKKSAAELFNLKMGLSPKGDSYNTENEGVPLLNGAADFEGAKISPKRHTSEPTRISNSGDIIFCIRGTIGNVCIGYEEYCLGRGVAALTPKKNATSYVYFSTIRAVESMTQAAAGSVIKGLTKNDIADRKIKLPPEDTLESFEGNALPIIKKIRVNSGEISNLTIFRDALLPRLISGKIEL